MQKINRLFYALGIFAVLFCSNAYADKIVQDAGALPEPAQQFLKATFPDRAVSYVKIDKNLIGPDEYKAILADGTEVEFDGKGQWVEIKAKAAGVPASVVPAPIATYVAEKFPNAKIQQIEKTRRGWSVELSNDLEVKFDKDLKFLRLDD